MERGKKLTLRQRQCIDRRELHFSNKEIARQLGLSPATVAMHLRLARRELTASQYKQEPGPHHVRRRLQPMQDSNQAERENAQLFWSEFMTKAAAGLMLWLTILALLALATSLLISRSQ